MIIEGGKKIGLILVFLILGVFSGNVVAGTTCNEYCLDLGMDFAGGNCYYKTCPEGTYFAGGTGTICYCDRVCCCYYGSTTTTTSTTTSTMTVPPTTTTIPDAAEFGSLGIAIAILLTTPVFAYLVVKKRG